MFNLIVYDPADGRIVSSVAFLRHPDDEVHAENIARQVPEGMGWMEGEGTSDTHHVDLTGEPMIMERTDLPDTSRAEAVAAISQERGRRLTNGVVIDVAGVGAIPVQGRERDQINMLALKDTARDLRDAGVTDAILAFRDGINVLHNLTPQQMIELVNGGKAAADHIWRASWALKDADPIPEDVTSDDHWL